MLVVVMIVMFTTQFLQCDDHPIQTSIKMKSFVTENQN